MDLARHRYAGREQLHRRRVAQRANPESGESSCARRQRVPTCPEPVPGEMWGEDCAPLQRRGTTPGDSRAAAAAATSAPLACAARPGICQAARHRSGVRSSMAASNPVSGPNRRWGAIDGVATTHFRPNRSPSVSSADNTRSLALPRVARATAGSLSDRYLAPPVDR